MSLLRALCQVQRVDDDGEIGASGSVHRGTGWAGEFCVSIAARLPQRDRSKCTSHTVHSNGRPVETPVWCRSLADGLVESLLLCSVSCVAAVLHVYIEICIVLRS